MYISHTLPSRLSLNVVRKWIGTKGSLMLYLGDINFYEKIRGLGGCESGQILGRIVLSITLYFCHFKNFG